jgi:hypothetical protein
VSHRWLQYHPRTQPFACTVCCSQQPSPGDGTGCQLQSFTLSPVQVQAEGCAPGTYVLFVYNASSVSGVGAAQDGETVVIPSAPTTDGSSSTVFAAVGAVVGIAAVVAVVVLARKRRSQHHMAQSVVPVRAAPAASSDSTTQVAVPAQMQQSDVQGSFTVTVVPTAGTAAHATTAAAPLTTVAEPMEQEELDAVVAIVSEGSDSELATHVSAAVASTPYSGSGKCDAVSSPTLTSHVPHSDTNHTIAFTYSNTVSHDRDSAVEISSDPTPVSSAPGDGVYPWNIDLHGRGDDIEELTSETAPHHPSVPDRDESGQLLQLRSPNKASTTTSAAMPSIEFVTAEKQGSSGSVRHPTTAFASGKPSTALR